MRILAPNVEAKENKRGLFVYYWRPHWRDRKKGCPMRCETLGLNVVEANARARDLNSRVEAWRNSRVNSGDGTCLLNINSVELHHAKEESSGAPSL